jgi:C4-dicarboxylate-specific signal transduction histidine kinase
MQHVYLMMPSPLTHDCPDTNRSRRHSTANVHPRARRESKVRVANSNTLNKLMSVQAVISAISHKIRQPVAAITANAGAARRWLERVPPDQNEARAALDEINNEGHRISEMFDGIRTLFGKVLKDQIR